MSFSEYTYVNKEHDEVMVDRGEDGDVLDIYTSASSSFLVPAHPRNPKSKTKKIAAHFGLLPAVERLRFRPRGKSNDYVHASDPQAAYTFLMRHGFQSSGGEDPDEGRA